MKMPNTNPPIVLGMSLDQFNVVQAILAKRPFDEVADLIIGFRRQVEIQVQRHHEEEQQEREQHDPRQRPYLASATEDNMAG